MRRILLYSAAVATTLLCSCINSDYDLANIDTNARVEVKDLTIPVKLETITLDKLISLDDDSQIQEKTDPVTGKKIYAVLEEGTFESSEVDIPSFSADKPEIKPIIAVLDLTKVNEDIYKKLEEVEQNFVNEHVNPPYVTEEMVWEQVKDNEDQFKQEAWNSMKDDLKGEPLAKYEFKVDKTAFKASANNVDKSIRSLESMEVYGKMSTEIQVEKLGDIISDIKIKDLKIALPAGLELKYDHMDKTIYNPQTGIFDFSKSEPVIKNGKFNTYEVCKDIIITKINAKDAGIVLNAKDNAPGNFTFENSVEVISGTLEFYVENFVEGKTVFDLPDEVPFHCYPDMSAIDVKKVTGNIKYDVDNMNINPITLNEIPDFLSNGETDVVLDNPQIYLDINNPLGGYGLYAETGLKVTASKENDVRPTIELDANSSLGNKKVIRLTAEKDNQFCIAPTDPTKYIDGYTKPTFAPFSDLKKIISGKGIPSKISVEAVSPCIPEQKITDLVLGSKLDKVKGNYTFFAPLALEEGSVIVYEKKDEGWDDETLSKLTINKLKVNATVTSQLPLEATITLYPLDKSGKHISGVEFNNAKLEANASNQEFVFEQTSGTIKNLDGIEIRATVVGKDAKKVLEPISKIEITNLKATVTGSYEDEF